MPEAVTLLDGAMGTELYFRGVDVPDYTTSLWSAKALIDAPEVVLQIHEDYVEAGADVITANNYYVTPPILARAGLEARFEELTGRAVELANQAREGASRGVRLAGSMPPLETSYRADLVGEDGAILETYRRMARVLAPGVDILLCETMSSAREALAAATAASETDREVWVSWTMQGDRPDRLPSGETVAEAFQAIAHLEVHAYLVNCCGANFVSRALKTLSGLTARRVGAFPNPVDVTPLGNGTDQSGPASGARSFLDVDGYAAAVAGWIEAGATIVGGCCGTRPENIARLRRLIDERSG